MVIFIPTLGKTGLNLRTEEVSRVCGGFRGPRRRLIRKEAHFGIKHC
jgi:hypothetical protein